MAFIPPEFIFRLVENANILDIIGEHVVLKKQGSRHVGLCPFHSEKTPSFSVNAEKGLYHCFGCGASGNALSFLTKHNGMEYIPAVELLAEMQGVSIPRAAGDQQKADMTSALGEPLQAAHRHFRANLKTCVNAQEYLKGRGIDGKTAALFQLGYAKAGAGYAVEEWNDLINALPKYDKKQLLAAGLIRDKDGKHYDYFRDRVMFPVFDGRGRLCGFGGRALDNSEPAKYLNSPESQLFSKRFLLYGATTKADAARKKGRVIIVEGYMDVVRLAQHGFLESVATMGTAAAMQQMGAALRLANNIVFAFDGDNAGRMAAAKALDGVLPSMRDGDSVRFLFLPDGEDPDSYIGKNGADAFEECINNAMPLGDFVDNYLWKDVGNDEGRASAVLAKGAKLARMINPQKAPYLRALLQKRLSDRAGVQVQNIKPAATIQKPKDYNRASYGMKPENKIFNLLCCLQASPELCKHFAEHTPPMPGSDFAAAEVLDVVLRRLLWAGEEGGDGKGESVAAIVHEAGFVKLGAQIQTSASRRYAAGMVDVGAEFLMIVDNLQKEHDKRTGKNKNEWLEKIRAGSREGE